MFGESVSRIRSLVVRFFVIRRSSLTEQTGDRDRRQAMFLISPANNGQNRWLRLAFLNPLFLLANRWKIVLGQQKTERNVTTT